MTKTRLSVLTAITLIVVSVGLMLSRRYVLGAEVDGPPGWRIHLVANGQLDPKEATITSVLPFDFRQQHILKESFQSEDLRYRIRKRKDSGRRVVVWRRRPGQKGAQPFYLAYTFQAVMRRNPTPAMNRRTAQVDAPPIEGSAQKPPRLESDHPEVFRKTRELVRERMTPRDEVRAFYDYVRDLQNLPTGAEGVEPAPPPGTPKKDKPARLNSAVACLRREGGDPQAKSRLLVALCRNRDIPARLVTGIILADTREQQPHYWAEAWVNEQWLPMCPTFRHFGEQTFPENYLVLNLGDTDLIRGPLRSHVHYYFRVENLHDTLGPDADRPPSAAKQFWRRLSFHALSPMEQQVVKFLLLLPLGALIVSLFRTVVGVPTYGTFSPALLGMAFLDLRSAPGEQSLVGVLKTLPWGVGIFVLTVLVGWLMRRLLERFHLLLVPRTAALLTLIVIFLLTVITLASRYLTVSGHPEGPFTHYIGLFPLVILTHLVERFWTVEAEDGTVASFKTLLGTMVVAVTIGVALSPGFVSGWMFRYPETLGVVLALQFLIGRYTGYRLSELYRFQDLIVDDDTTAGKSP